MPRRVPLPPSLTGRAFTVDEARDAGLSPERLRGEDLSSPFHGVRVAAPDGGALLDRCRAYATRMRPGQFFSHLTAARIWGAPLPVAFGPEEKLHVASFAPQRPPRTRGVIGHELPPGSAPLVLRHGLAVSSAASSWVQLAGLLPSDELVVVGDHLVLNPALLDPVDPRPFTSVDELSERLAGYGGRGKRVALRALARVRAGAESRPETLLRLLLVDAGLPEPLLNQVLRDPAGRFLGRVDMVYPEWRLVVEYDGDQHRTSTTQYERDLSRLEAIRRAGWTVVTVRKHGLFVRPDLTVARVHTALIEAGWRR
ncbi:endonuclease domain-containing protein [Microterricola pindariensis]|uniref:DUF559 domain-containing protein n=1 Tax=Microterricola pindariensis TaxID=478010 RepID=A0ABX5AWL6_9MICO|nr:DUF559 domain-containing protein [Microterricola pindariensis]PPL19318.1 hypothetical protein GY24_06355 [Microterricola pindariensis]